MFAALELIDYGIKPLIFERGKKIEENVSLMFKDLLKKGRWTLNQISNSVKASPVHTRTGSCFPR